MTHGWNQRYQWDGTIYFDWYLRALIDGRLERHEVESVRADINRTLDEIIAKLPEAHVGSSAA